jgi:hypothetical protein
VLSALALVIATHGSRLFIWPAYGTLSHQRAQDMARHGDPEAQRFVNGQTDINPFDVR